jgi:hypothetical protein
MCQACEEMQLYYAYLDAVEEAKRKAQPWQCEVTVIPQPDQAPTAVPAAPAASAQSANSGSANSGSAKSGFSCDEPE